MTTITIKIPSWGHDVTKIQTNMAEPSAPVCIDHGMGNGWEHTAYQAADMNDLEGIARLLVADAYQVPVDDLPDDLEIGVA